MQLQQTLRKSYSFEGKGLHTGKVARMIVGPAPVDTGIIFRRTDLGEGVQVEALAENVSSTARSTTISNGEASVSTIEHVLSALTGMGVDNAYIDIDNVEVPILDGSAKPYIDAIWADGFEQQDAPRRYIEIKETVEIVNEEKGSKVRIEPAEEFSYSIKVDFNSRVLGVQNAQWNPSVEYPKEIGVCRTFVFFHEIEFLFNNGLVKGGDVDNAIPALPARFSRELSDTIRQCLSYNPSERPSAEDLHKLGKKMAEVSIEKKVDIRKPADNTGVHEDIWPEAM